MSTRNFTVTVLAIVAAMLGYGLWARSQSVSSFPNCQSIGQVLEGTKCSPAPDNMNGRYVCREHGAAIREVCETYGTKVPGGVVYSEGKTIPPSVGTIRCNKDGDDKVSITIVFGHGDDLGIIGPPLSNDSSVPDIDFGTDLYGYDSETHVGGQKMSLSVTASFRRTNFTPRLIVDNEIIRYFDLAQWTIAGDCTRIGCMMCRDGERCPKPDSAECVASSIQAH